MQAAHPIFVAIVGLHGSASTWAFNIVREQLSSVYGAETVYGFSTEQTVELLRDRQCAGRHVVWKVHAGDQLSDLLFQFARPITIVTIRDPRDALLSFCRRFEPSPERGIAVLARDCRLALSCSDAGALVLRYENGFVKDRAVLDQIADSLKLSIATKTQDTLFVRYDTEAVHGFADHLQDLPAERLLGGGSDVYDRLTHIHKDHIGEEGMGSWRERLPASCIDQANAAFAPFLTRFGYPS